MLNSQDFINEFTKQSNLYSELSGHDLTQTAEIIV